MTEESCDKVLDLTQAMDTADRVNSPLVTENRISNINALQTVCSILMKHFNSKHWEDSIQHKTILAKPSY